MHLPATGLLAAAVSCALSLSSMAGKPNIVFLFTDDQAPDTIAAANVWGVDHSQIQTPHMDRLFHGGTSFSHAYNMGAWHAAVCVASRSMLNSGRFLWHARRAEKGGFQGMIRGQRLWSQRMKAAGYETYLSGKWHITAPPARIFDHVHRIRPGMPGTVKAAYSRPADGKPDAWLPWDPANGGYWEGGKHWSEVLADDTESMIKRAALQDKPFFMYVAFNAPHDPRQSPQSFLEMYPLENIRTPRNMLPLNPHHAAMGLGPTDGTGMRDEALAPFPRTEFAVKTHRREYQALVSHLDAQIGRIVAALEREGLAGNTYIILTSDHGLALGRHGLLGKQNLYEHSLRVPFIITGPGIPKGKTVDARIYLQDAMATTLELAGADREGIDFKSVMPLIAGKSNDRHEGIYAAFGPRDQRAVIDGGHKMILYPAGRTSLLFDLAKDPLEMEDLSKTPEALPMKRQLFQRLLQLQKETGDPLDLTADFPDFKP